MARPDVVAYLHENINKFPVEQLKQQLLAEGVSEAEFTAALTATQSRRRRSRARVFFGRFLLIGGLGLVGVAAYLSMAPKSRPADDAGAADASATAATAASAKGETAFLGHSGYVLKLPQDYVAVTRFKDGDKNDEIVHFCRAGTDPTNFLNEGLYGQLGIVRLEVTPSPFAGQINGLEQLAAEITSSSQQRGEKFTLKNITISGLHGIQVTYDAPDARVETYVLGQNVMYFFMAGQDDEINRAIIQSLRDAQSEI